jgi:hypothetical protein
MRKKVADKLAQDGPAHTATGVRPGNLALIASIGHQQQT